MMSTIEKNHDESPSDPITFETLPYAFRRRVIELAPGPSLFNFRYTSQQLFDASSFRGTFVQNLVVTVSFDDECVKSYVRNGTPFTFFTPDEFLALKKPVFVKNDVKITLVDPKRETKVASFIPKFYKNVLLVGFFDWHDAMSLLHPNLNHARFYANSFNLEEDNIKEFIETVLAQVKINVEFTLVVVGCSVVLRDKLTIAFGNHATHKTIVDAQILLLCISIVPKNMTQRQVLKLWPDH